MTSYHELITEISKLLVDLERLLEKHRRLAALVVDVLEELDTTSLSSNATPATKSGESTSH